MKIGQFMSKISLCTLGIALFAFDASASSMPSKETYKPLGDAAFIVENTVSQFVDPTYGVISFNHLQTLIPNEINADVVPVVNFKAGHVAAVQESAQEGLYKVFILNRDGSKIVYDGLKTVSKALKIGDLVKVNQIVGRTPSKGAKLNIEYVEKDGTPVSLFDKALATHVNHATQNAVMTSSQGLVGTPAIQFRRNIVNADFEHTCDVDPTQAGCEGYGTTWGAGVDWGNPEDDNGPILYTGSPTGGLAGDRSGWQNVTAGAAVDSIAGSDSATCPSDVHADLLARNQARLAYMDNLRNLTYSDPPNAQSAACFDLYQGNMAGPVAQTFAGSLSGIIGNVFGGSFGSLLDGVGGADGAADAVLGWAVDNLSGQMCDTSQNVMGDIRDRGIPVDALYSDYNTDNLMAVLSPGIVGGSRPPTLSDSIYQAAIPGGRATIDFGTGGITPMFTPPLVAPQGSGVQLPGGVTVGP